MNSLLIFTWISNAHFFIITFFCFLTSHRFDIKVEENKTYSWDLKRQNVDVSKYTIEDVKNDEVGRVPGEINGKSI